MAKFKHGDVVVSTSNTGIQVEAVVDFEKEDKVYISEWGKTLSNPVRYVIDKEGLYKKSDGKLTLSLQEMNALMAQIMQIAGASYDKEPTLENLEQGQQLSSDGRTYKYVGMLDGEPVRDTDGYFCVIDKEDIKHLLWSREDVCQKLFGLSEKDVNVI